MSFKIGDQVEFRKLGETKWHPATVDFVQSDRCSYLVKLDGSDPIRYACGEDCLRVKP